MASFISGKKAHPVQKMKKGGEYKGYAMGGPVAGNCNRRRSQYS